MTLDRGRLPRWLALALGLRRLSPGPDDRLPDLGDLYQATDTGGGPWRPTFRPQAPWEGGSEPVSESNSLGEEHCWNQCSMCSGCMAYGWHVQGTSPKGGQLRHAPGQPDMSGGTDLYDVRDAWDGYGGQVLKIWSGQGWGAVQQARADWRAIVLQGTGNTPGSGTYTGAHAVVVLPERPASGSDWLMGDPLCDGYQWVPESKLRDWAKAFSSGVAFAVSKPWPPDDPEPPEPAPGPPEPAPVPIPPRLDAPASWAVLGGPAASWQLTAWGDIGWSAAWGAWGPTWYWPRPAPAWGDADWLSPWAG